MKASKLSLEDEKMRIHLDRAKDLGVDLPEYADAFGVNLRALSDVKARLEGVKRESLDVSDFVKVNIADSYRKQESVCSISLPCGLVLQCNDWPPSGWLQSLGGTVG